MAVRRAVLVIADISGYTQYMQWNRTHLAHAQLTVAGLLEAVIDAGKGMKLAKLEGDAAFFWPPDGNAQVLVCDRLSRMRHARSVSGSNGASPANARAASSWTSCRSSSSSTRARWQSKRSSGTSNSPGST